MELRMQDDKRNAEYTVCLMPYLVQLPPLLK